ncbi:hypothetical protein APSETT444_009698 [Aspergillus pseudonomiae]
MALREVESPKSENVVVFLNLALFWYSHGQFRRSNMLTGCASNTAWVLGVPPDEKSNGSSLDSEMQRRRFWACYLQCSFQADTLFPKIPTEGMLNIRLPCSESEFQLGNPQSSVTLKDVESTQSIYAELIRAMALWSSVVLLIKQTGLSLASRLAEMQTLDGRIHEAWSKLDPYPGKPLGFLGSLGTIILVLSALTLAKLMDCPQGRFACGLYKVHASDPFPLAGEPKNMTPDALREFKPASLRARLSILTHNSIIISDQGSTAQGTDDIGDLGLENANSRESGPAEENLAGFISQISSEVGVAGSELPITINPFLHLEAVGSCLLDGSLNQPIIGSDMDQIGHIEDCILELLRHEGLLQQGAS